MCCFVYLLVSGGYCVSLGIDSVTDEEEYRIGELFKICQSFSYFLESYAHIEDKVAKRPMLFRLWPAQWRILPDIEVERLLVILKARQLGLTWLCAAYTLWITITQQMKLSVVISAKGDWAVEFLERVYFILKLLPSWVYPPVEKDTTETFRVRHYNGLYSTIKSLTTTESGAQSKTPDLLILDETCWNPYVREIYSASEPGIEMAKGRIIIISNSIKAAPGWGWTRTKFIEAWRQENDFKYIFMPWQDQPGRPENFREIEMTRKGKDEQDVIEHYPETIEEAISAIAGSYFGKTLSRHDVYIRDSGIEGDCGSLRRGSLGDDLEFVSDDRGIMEVWRWPYHIIDNWDGLYWYRRYAIGADISEGLGQSYSVGYVLDRLKDELVCRVRSNRLDATEFAKVLYWLSYWYRSGTLGGDTELALICAERTGAGITTVKELSRLGANQYVRMVPGKIGSEMTKEFGWHESVKSRHDLCADLKAWFRTTEGGFYCPILVDEASTTIQHEGTERIGPEDSTRHWDCVVAAGCTIQSGYQLEGSPKKLYPEVTDGWRYRAGEEGRSNWVL